MFGKVGFYPVHKTKIAAQVKLSKQEGLSCGSVTGIGPFSVGVRVFFESIPAGNFLLTAHMICF